MFLVLGAKIRRFELGCMRNQTPHSKAPPTDTKEAWNVIMKKPSMCRRRETNFPSKIAIAQQVVKHGPVPCTSVQNAVPTRIDVDPAFQLDPMMESGILKGGRAQSRPTAAAARSGGRAGREDSLRHGPVASLQGIDSTSRPHRSTAAQAAAVMGRPVLSRNPSRRSRCGHGTGHGTLAVLRTVPA